MWKRLLLVTGSFGSHVVYGDGRPFTTVGFSQGRL